MSRAIMSFDLAIVGAGSAGAALALHASRAGLNVIVLDRRPLDDAGARWVNGVARWMFEEGGIDAPRGDERVGEEKAFHLVAGRHAAARVVVRDPDVEGVDMRRLVARLQEGARDAGAELRGEVHVHGREGRTLRTNAGDVAARYIVDASGLAGPRLLGQARVDPLDVCAAAQEVRRVTDLRAARAWFERYEVAVGDTLCFTGVAGGYSILNVRLDGDRVSILTGSIPALGHPSGARILADFAREEPWVGEPLFGGARSLPLRRPYASLTDGTVALLGDAACQMFSAHGSGVGIGLVAARMLARALASGAGPARYEVDFHRRWGGLVAGYDVFRRFSQRLTAEDVAGLMRAGLLDEQAARAGLSQRLPLLTRSLVAGRAAAAARAPRSAGRFARVLGRMLALQALAAAYPASRAALPAWSRAMARVSSDALVT